MFERRATSAMTREHYGFTSGAGASFPSETRELPNHGVLTGYRIHRVLANRWELTRASGGWKIKSRKLRPLDGSAPARDILANALASHRPAD
ncbi:MAG: hypothetical protein OXG62_13885 [Nitrospinae bacterium]|nr:hypothetical protein [Nitrospinota bacterium]